MKKILIVTDFYYPHISGITNYIEQQVKFLIANGNNVTILTTKHNNNLQKEEKFLNLKIIRVEPNFKISRGFFSLKLSYEFKKLIKYHDLVFLHYPLTEIFLFLFLLKKNKTIFFYHCLPSFNNFLFKIFKFYFLLFGIVMMIRSKRVVFLSIDYLKNLKFTNSFKSKCLEIPPYVKASKNKMNVKINDKFTIGYLGRISFEKNLEVLIEASIYLKNIGIVHKLIIAGDDEDERFLYYINKIKNLANKYKHISFIGKIAEKNKAKFYNNLNIFILPSNNSLEGFGIVQLEAMSCNIPVIARDIPGVRTIIKKTNSGLLFSSKQQLIDNILNLKQKKLVDYSISKKVSIYYSRRKFNENMQKLINF